MTPEAQRIVIAEACGKRAERKTIFGDIVPTDGWNLPDYLHDHNTRGEMLSVIADKRLCIEFENQFYSRWDALTVPQPIFCESFLRTIGKWRT